MDGYPTALCELTWRSLQLLKVWSPAVHARYNAIRAAKQGNSEVASAIMTLVVDSESERNVTAVVRRSRGRD